MVASFGFLEKRLSEGQVNGEFSESSTEIDEIRGSAGYQAHEEDAAELIPDDALRGRTLDFLQISAADLGRFGSNSESGFAGTMELEGLPRIGGTRWFIGGMMRGRVSPEFDNATAMLVLRYGSDQPAYTVKRQYRESFSLHD